MPSFAPWLWNSQPVIGWHNCYDYARDRIVFAAPNGLQPGVLSGRRVPGPGDPALTHDVVIAAASSDGLQFHGDRFMPCGSRHLLALRVLPAFDYHWYRLDDAGIWSHKPGTSVARAHDDAGLVISDPRDVGSMYPVFAGFFCADRVQMPAAALAGLTSVQAGTPSTRPPVPIDPTGGSVTLSVSGGYAMAQIEALIYSGSPNPVRKLDPDRSRQMNERMARLKDAPARTIAPGLGYSGCRVTFARGEGDVVEAVAFGGTVTISFADGKRCSVQDTESVEETLVEYMGPASFSNLPEAFRPPSRRA